MTKSPTIVQPFPPFSLSRLLRTVFAPKAGERIAVLIDLDQPADMQDFRFLQDSHLTIQRIAHDVFYRQLHSAVMPELGLQSGEMFAYRTTGGSNLDLPDTAVASDGSERNLGNDILSKQDIVLCISTFSATAPLTALAKQLGFRGATLHGVNEIILNSGLAVDYEEVSRQAERLRGGMTTADQVEIDYEVGGTRYQLRVELGGQEAQKSHGLCRSGPDVANLPAGEIYFVPTGAEGSFPLKYDDGTLGLMHVRNGRIFKATLLQGAKSRIEEHNEKLRTDPVTGELGELGFGTQQLPVSGRDIQDEKILGTFHLATGRSDHLGGSLTPDRFANRKNATHDDILFSPTKTPEIHVPQVRMTRAGKTEVLIEEYAPAAYIRSLLVP